jgi:imidazolonepropionase-like amidohydrolase
MRIPWIPCRKEGFSLPVCLAAISLAAGLVLAPEGLRSGEPPVFAITNARIITVSGPAIESGTVVVRNSIIESVGTGISVPADARVIDAKGLILYPGLIDSLSDAGLEEARPPVAATARPDALVSPAQPDPSLSNLSPDERQGLTPYLQAADILNPASRKIEAARAAGITTALVVPGRGFFRGQSSLINLAGSRIGNMVVKTPVFLHISFANAGGFGSAYPSSLMGVIAFVRQTLLDAQDYEQAWNTYNSNPGVPRPEYSRALQSLVPAIRQQIAVVLPGDTPAQIQRALDLAAAFKLRMILSGGAEAGKIAPMLRELNVPVLLSARFPERERDVDPQAEEELAVLRRRVEAPSHAVAFANAGVRFAFQSDAMANPRDFIRNVGRTVEAGLDRAAALRSLTLTPAEIFGVADKLGSIEKGKCANLVLATGDIFDARTRIKLVFVDGRMFEIPEEETAAAGTAQSAGATGAAGSWTLRINSPHGPLEVTLKLQQFGSDLTGTLTSPFGTVDISEGMLSGNNVTFKANINPPGGGSFVVLFRGILKDDTMSGSADAGIIGKMEFTGSKSPNNP